MTMKQHIITLAFLGITAFGISGVFAWPNKIESVGYFKLARNPWGTAIYQDGLHQTIQFNGFNKTTKNDKTVIIERNPNALATIDYSRDDILLDAKGTVYTESKIQEMEAIATQSGMLLTHVQTDNRLSVPASTLLYLINPRIPGMVAIQFPSHTKVTINLERKAIEFPAAIKTLVVHVYDTIPSFKKNL